MSRRRSFAARRVVAARSSARKQIISSICGQHPSACDVVLRGGIDDVAGERAARRAVAADVEVCPACVVVPF
jgi:hypothetical protein